MLYKDLSIELLREFQKSVVHFAVLTDGCAECSMSAASIHEEGFSVCLPLGQHPLPQLIQRLNSFSNKQINSVGPKKQQIEPTLDATTPDLDPAIACLSQVVEHIKSLHSSSKLQQITRVIVISMSTHLFAPFLVTLQKFVVQLSSCNSFFDIVHILDPDDISSTFSCQSDVHLIASLMSDYDNFTLKVSTTTDHPIKTLLTGISSQLWEFPATIRFDQGLSIHCRGRLGMHVLSQNMRKRLREIQCTGEFQCDLVGKISVADQNCGLSQTLIYGLPIYLIPSDNYYSHSPVPITFKNLTKSLVDGEVFLFRTTLDLLELNCLPHGVFHYCIGSLPHVPSSISPTQQTSDQYINPICIQGLIPHELQSSLPLDELLASDENDVDDTRSQSLCSGKLVDKFSPLEFPTSDISSAINEAQLGLNRLPPSNEVLVADRAAPKARSKRASAKRQATTTIVPRPSTSLWSNQNKEEYEMQTPYQISTAGQLYNQKLTHQLQSNTSTLETVSSSSNCQRRITNHTNLNAEILPIQKRQPASPCTSSHDGGNSSNKISERELMVGASNPNSLNTVPPGNSIGLIKRIQSRVAQSRGSQKI